MTIDTFIRRLRAKVKQDMEGRGREVFVVRGGEIRTRGPREWCRCPIEYLAGVSKGFYDIGGTELGLSYDDTEDIAIAADTRDSDPDMFRLRNRLLRAVGLPADRKVRA